MIYIVAHVLQANVSLSKLMVPDCEVYKLGVCSGYLCRTGSAYSNEKHCVNATVYPILLHS